MGNIGELLDQIRHQRPQHSMASRRLGVRNGRPIFGNGKRTVLDFGVKKISPWALQSLVWSSKIFNKLSSMSVKRDLPKPFSRESKGFGRRRTPAISPTFALQEKGWAAVLVRFKFDRLLNFRVRSIAERSVSRVFTSAEIHGLRILGCESERR